MVNLIIDLWEDIKSFVPAKDRIEVADRLVARFDAYGMADGIDSEPGLDKTLRAAVQSYYHIDENEDDDYNLDDADDYEDDR